MNVHQNAQQQADKEVLAVLNRKAPDLAGFTTVAEDKIIFESNIVDNDEQNKILETSTKGYTDLKNASKIYVVNTALRPVSTRLMAYASRNKLEVLKNEINYTENSPRLARVSRRVTVTE